MKVEDCIPQDDVDVQLHMWAIERAIERATASGSDGERDIMRAAQAFVDFVMGTNDAEIVRTARELADKVKRCAGVTSS